ncbi:MAG TPA: aspartate 1-decarboxylase [Flavobacteriales bacterium]|nr:aspartate 1-decarboxylase [Flavobacteriales bacterium]
MTIEVVRTKIHRVRVSEANLDHIGGITIGEDLIDAIVPTAQLGLEEARRSRPSIIFPNEHTNRLRA